MQKNRIKPSHAKKESHAGIPQSLVKQGVVRSMELEQAGLTRSAIRRLATQGILERLGWGIYRIVASEPSEHFTTAVVCKRVPQAIVCLISALSIHEIGTQIPHEVWIAIDSRSHRPKLGDLPVRIVRFSGTALRYGIQERTVQGVAIRITSPARTVVDCFRYRRKIGLDVALEALKEALRGRKATMDQIVRAAEACRALNVMRPYLESLA